MGTSLTSASIPALNPPQLKRISTDGKALGITGTPTMYINGYTISGAAALDTLHDLVQQQVDSSQEKKAADSGSKPQAKAKRKSASQMARLN